MSAFDYEREGGPEAPSVAQVAAFLRALKIDAGRWLSVPRRLPVVTPSAGADWATATPSGCITVLYAVNATLTTSATVANRSAAVTFGDGSSTLLTVAPPLLQAASVVSPYSYYRGAGAPSTAVPTGAVNAPLPFFPLPGNTTIASLTANIQAGDTWTAITLWALVIRERTWQEMARYAEDVDGGVHAELYPGPQIGF